MRENAIRSVFCVPWRRFEIQTSAHRETRDVRTAFLTPKSEAPTSAWRISGESRWVRRPDQSLAALIRGDRRLSRFGRCLLATGLLDDLDEAGVYTVFAPRDGSFDLTLEAFEAWFAPEATNLLFDVAEYHVARGEYIEPALPASIPTLEGRSVELTLSRGGLTVNQRALVHETWLTKNGVLHLTDHLLVPSGIQLGPDGRLALESADRPSGVHLVQPELRSIAENLGDVPQFE